MAPTPASPNARSQPAICLVDRSARERTRSSSSPGCAPLSRPRRRGQAAGDLRVAHGPPARPEGQGLGHGRARRADRGGDRRSGEGDPRPGPGRRGNGRSRSTPMRTQGGPHSLSVSGKKDTVVFDGRAHRRGLDAARSQSEHGVAPISASNDGDLEALVAVFPKIRLITVPQVGTQEPLCPNFKGQWEACTPDTVKRLLEPSRYCFGRQIYRVDRGAGRADRRLPGAARRPRRGSVATGSPADPKFKGLPRRVG